MKRSSYNEPNYAFGQAILTLRTTTGLTQTSVAEHLGISRKAVGEWEAGLNYPKAAHLRAFIALAVEKHAFPAGREEDEIRTLWQAARRKVPLDEAWLSGLLPGVQVPPTSPSARAGTPHTLRVPALAEGGPRVDWSDALVVSTFYGREWELNLLNSWIIEEHCRVVSVLGLGGIGKSALSIRIMHQAAEHFDVVIWRSLREAPTFEELLGECLQMLVPQALRDVSMSLERRLNLLLEALRATRVLLVLDNLEVLLEEGQSMGHMRAGYEGYTQLLRRIAETEHQSCLLLTSREKPSDLVPMEGSRAPVRVLRLARLDTNACQQVLAEKEVIGSVADHARLIEAYEGNPLALKIVAQTIVDLFDGQIASFLEQGEVVFGGVRELLDEQYARLADHERILLGWLAIVRESVSIKDLLEGLAVPLSRSQGLEAVEGLRRRSLIERGQLQGSVALQSVVLEYVTARLIMEMASEIEQGGSVRLSEHGLEMATAKEYVRQTQRRLIVTPLLAQLQKVFRGRTEVERNLLALLDQQRVQASDAQGYGPANLLVLLRELRGHLRGLDLSRLSIRGVSLQGVEMQDTTLSEATLRDTTFTEALNATRTVAISPNGQYWAAGSWQGKVRVWQRGGKSLHLAWQAHTDTVSTIAFSPDGRALATGSWDGALKLWDIKSGDLLWTNWRTNTIQTLAFAPDGNLLASGGNDATIQLWDAHRGTHRQMFPSKSGAVYALTWSPDGRLLASGGLDGSIQLWEVGGGQPEVFVWMIKGHTDWVFALAFAHDGRLLASGSFDQTVKLWEVESGRVCETLTGHTDKVRSVAFSPDGRTLASCGFDRATWLWDVERRSYRMILQGHTAAIHSLAFTPDSRILLSGSDDGTIRVWEVASGQCLHIMQGYSVSLYDVAWNPDGTKIASAGSDTLLTIWQVNGRTQPNQLRGHTWIVHGVAWSPNGRFLASCGWDNAIRIWDVSTSTCIQLLRDGDHIDTFFYSIAWSPDGKFLASGSYQRGIYLWNVATATCHWISHTAPTIIRRIEWSLDGTQLVSCNDEGSVCLWNASNGQLRVSLRGHSGIVASVAWSPDGTKIASAGGGQGSGEIIVWDAHSGERLYILSEQGGMTYALAWDSSGSMLISGGGDGALCWWDVQSGERILLREAHQGKVQQIRRSPDGAKLASCGDDGAIRLWDLYRGEHLHTLRRDRPYERLAITRIKGLSEAQKASLYALGAFGEMNIED